MSRVTLRYGDRDYSIGDRSLVQVREEIESSLLSGRPGWLQVNAGEGRPSPTLLLLMPGVPLAIRDESSSYQGDSPIL